MEKKIILIQEVLLKARGDYSPAKHNEALHLLTTPTKCSQYFNILLLSHQVLLGCSQGTGNYLREGTETVLVNLVDGWTRLQALRSEVRLSVFNHMVGFDAAVFMELCCIVRPYIALPKRFSVGLFEGSDVLTFRPVEVYSAESGHGRPPSQHPDDRFLHFLLFCRRSGALSHTTEGCRYSPGSISNELRHVCWAVITSLHMSGYLQMPDIQYLNAVWDNLPDMLKGAFGNRGNVSKFPLCLDCSFRPLPQGSDSPPNRSDYYNGKPNVKKEVFCNLLMVTLEGRLCFARCGAMGGIGEHFVLRSSDLCQNLYDYIPEDSEVGILTDGLFVGVHPLMDQRLLLPYAGRLTEEERHFNKVFSYLRSIVENVFGAIDAMFRIIKHPGVYSYQAQPYLTYACYLLYDAVRHRTGYICKFRMNYLYDDGDGNEE